MRDEAFDKGMQIRRELFGAELGEKHVKEATDFTRNFQDVVTRYCFAEVWGNEDLPRRLRSIATLSMVVALGKWIAAKHDASRDAKPSVDLAAGERGADTGKSN